MKQIDKDRNILKTLVESYGKEDVLNYIKHLNENTDDWWVDDEDEIEDAAIEWIENNCKTYIRDHGAFCNYDMRLMFNDCVDALREQGFNIDDHIEFVQELFDYGIELPYPEL